MPKKHHKEKSSTADSDAKRPYRPPPPPPPRPKIPQQPTIEDRTARIPIETAQIDIETGGYVWIHSFE